MSTRTAHRFLGSIQRFTPTPWPSRASTEASRSFPSRTRRTARTTRSLTWRVGGWKIDAKFDADGAFNRVNLSVVAGELDLSKTSVNGVLTPYPGPYTASSTEQSNFSLTFCGPPGMTKGLDRLDGWDSQTGADGWLQLRNTRCRDPPGSTTRPARSPSTSRAPRLAGWRSRSSRAAASPSRRGHPRRGRPSSIPAFRLCPRRWCTERRRGGGMVAAQHRQRARRRRRG